MNEKIKALTEQVNDWVGNYLDSLGEYHPDWHTVRDNKFAELIIQECLDRIESYKIPCGNSPAGELACEWTYDALKTIRDDIKETFGIE